MAEAEPLEKCESAEAALKEEKSSRDRERTALKRVRKTKNSSAGPEERENVAASIPRKP
jgi:hypothetical protein